MKGLMSLILKKKLQPHAKTIGTIRLVKKAIGGFFFFFYQAFEDVKIHDMNQKNHFDVYSKKT